MSKTSVIAARIDEETMALVDQVSRAHNRSRGWFAARAIADAARREAGYLAFVQEGIDAADRGELIAHDEVFERVRARRAQREPE